MSEPAGGRSAELADEFEAAQEAFAGLVESLSDEQWTLVGTNFPERLNDEDEGRTVGVIAHHVAVSGQFISDRIGATLEGRPVAPVDIRSLNAAHAVEHAGARREEVVALLREKGPTIGAFVRALSERDLATSLVTPAGPMTIEQRIERVLIGHLKGHGAVIEATLSRA